MLATATNTKTRANAKQSETGTHRKVVWVYLSQEQFELITMAAQRDNLSRSRWLSQTSLGVLRGQLTDAKAQTIAMQELHSAIAALNKVGSNLNQIARVANSYGIIVPELPETLYEIAETTKKLYLAYTRVEAIRP